MADLRRMRADLVVFAREVGCALEPFQARALALEARATVVVGPRQSGKSRSLAVLALHRAFRRRGTHVLIVSGGGESGAFRLLAEVRRVAAGSPLLAGSVVDEQAGLLRLSNGSEIRSVPASERQVRGWSVDLLLVDEAALVSDDLLLGAALPTTAARPEARVVLASSAGAASGSFFDHFVRGERGDEHVRSFRWRLLDCPWISPSVVEAARASMSAVRFAAEYEGVFATGQDLLFSPAALAAVTVDVDVPGLAGLGGPARLLGGCDWGVVNDRSAFAWVARLAGVGALNGVDPRVPVYLANAIAWPAGTPLARVVEDVASSPGHWDVMSSENVGVGAGPTQHLFARMRGRRPQDGGGPRRRVVLVDDGATVSRPRNEERPPGWAMLAADHPSVMARPRFTTRLNGVSTSAPLKALVYPALAELIAEGRLLLPAAAVDLRRELALLTVELTPSGVERIEARAGGHDDLPDALYVASAPYRRRGDRGRAGLASVLLNAAANRSRPEARLPDEAVGEFVQTAGGLRVPRRPVLQSVTGPEATVPDRWPMTRTNGGSGVEHPGEAAA